jgi:uncharacterized membrane protein YtjA (UPF0391 family)
VRRRDAAHLPPRAPRRFRLDGGNFFHRAANRRTIRSIDWATAGSPAMHGSDPRSGVESSDRSQTMLKWALIFFIVAIVAAAFGFTGIAAGAATIAKVLFGIFLVVFLIFLVLGLMAGEALFGRR